MKQRRLTARLTLAALVATFAMIPMSPTAIADPPVGKLQVDSFDPSAPSASQFAKDTSGLTALQSLVYRNAPGYAGSMVDESAGTLTVYWNGDAPKSIQDLAAGSYAGRLRVINNAPFSHERVANASDALIGSSEWCERLGVTLTAVATDGSGLQVYVTGDTPTDSIKAELEEFLGLPGGITFVPHSEPVQPQ